MKPSFCKAAISGGASASVEMARLSDDPPSKPEAVPETLPWTQVATLQPAAESLKFVVSEGWTRGVFACRVTAGGARSAAILLNAPDPWWFQGDEGKAATPGGWLRVFGKCLATAKGAAIRLEPEKGSAVLLHPRSADDYAIQVDLPRSLPLRKCVIRVHNGAGGNAAWQAAGTVEIQAPREPDTKVFSVLDFYGPEAVKEMRKSLIKYTQPVDRTEGIQSALAKAKANGGGIVYFPAGRYLAKSALVVPDHTILRGEGEGVVTLWWGAGHFNLDGGGPQGRALVDEPKPPRTLIDGSDFGIEEMSLFLPLEYVQGIAAEKRFRMHHVRVRIDHYWLVQGRGNGAVARLGNNFEVTDCDILAKGDALVPGQYGVIARNRIAANKSNTPMGGGQEVIVEDNQFVSMDPTAYQNISSDGRDIYYAHNTHEALYAQQSDYSFTFDAGTGAYIGGISAVNGTQLTLADDPVYPKWAPEKSEHWRRAAVFLLEGRGAGQWRKVVANTGRTWSIDRPFDVAPDASSVASIVFFNGRVLVIGNRFEDANWVNAGYGTSIDVICAENHLARCAELMNHGVRAEGHGFEPSWHVQYLDNQIAEGQTSIGSSGAGHEEVPGFTGPLTWCCVHRRHVVGADNSGSISIGGNVRDVIVDGCTLNHPLSFIKVDEKALGVLLRNNHFEGGGAPRYEGGGIKSAIAEEAGK